MMYQGVIDQNLVQTLTDMGYSGGQPVYRGVSNLAITNPGLWRTLGGQNNLGDWQIPFTSPTGGTQYVPYRPTANETFGYNNQGQLVSMMGGANTNAKTTADLLAEQNAKNTAIDQRKAAYDASMANQFGGYFDFLNKPMEVSPFQLQNGQAVMTRPTYGGQPPQTGFGQQASSNLSLSSLYRQGNTVPGMTAPQAQPQVDLGQMYQLFSNPYLAQLASLLFANSSWLK